VVIIFGLYSFWVPQILYSAYSGGRKALELPYVLGMSASRLFFPLYVFGCPHNVYHVLSERPTLSLAASLTLLFWMAAQVTVLWLQVTSLLLSPPLTSLRIAGARDSSSLHSSCR
jgi:transmembrane E3 ubiquitin-protein ligase